MAFEVGGQDSVSALGREMIMRPGGAMTNVAHAQRKRYNWSAQGCQLQAAAR